MFRILLLLVISFFISIFLIGGCIIIDNKIKTDNNLIIKNLEVKNLEMKIELQKLKNEYEKFEEKNKIKE